MMIQSAKPRIQRLFRFTAPMHARQHFMHAHVDKELRKKIGLNKRAIRIARGDSVKIMAGAKKGTTGKVTAVDLRRGRIQITNLTKKNAKGKEFSVSISPSNVYITDLNLEDKIRAAKLKLQQVKAPKEGPKPAVLKPPIEDPAPLREAKAEVKVEAKM
jgi:ribosomal protein uL24